MYLRTFRVEQLCKAYFYIQPLFTEIAHRANLSLYELCLCSLDEMRLFLNGHTRIDKKEVNHRKTKYAYVIKKGVFTCYSGQKAEEIFNEEVSLETLDKTKVNLTGNIACRGIAIGKTHIISDKSEMASFKKREVLGNNNDQSGLHDFNE